ncbi:FMN-binding glutamate synthase family protein [Sporosarcina sp. Marseille-Q4063]|uniref:FMN-binding glutamate synthase family protein n=1 Tax=Sporosarcina sp. Marseille-Q4063 TaxID=2810514 RepID=UPI001BB07E28|nr:FMN-binding glutamate synthase family protein [Sporosarcina sp. Marseille-Q4063]QUW23799.1 FMN-binding glutamate synthase family protein [Sporosarcina sp. Marseille-Q4063]
MNWFVEGVSITTMIVISILVIVPIGIMVFLYLLDRRQKQHAILRNFPILGRMRYMLEKTGPELRQYLFNDDNDGEPFNREEYLHMVLPGKYLSSVIGFGSKRDFDESGYFIRNAMFTKQNEEMRVDNETLVDTMRYLVDEDGLFARREHREEVPALPWLLPEEDAVIIGPNCEHPFHVRSLLGQSGMSYGALGENAITALSKGIGMAKGAWMNTGEGGLSKYHLAGGADIIAQIGSGLFGFRTEDGEFSWERLREKAEIPEVKAFEIKLAQGAKMRGGHVEGEKVTEEIAAIRNVVPFTTINSPNRFHQFSDYPTLFDFIDKIRDHTGKPVGIKLVIGGKQDAEELASFMHETGLGPDFISLDGAEGGSGATYQDLADGVGLPLRSALILLDDALRKFEVRDRVKIIASGKVTTPDRAAIALAMGADLVQIARGFMISVGCIMAERCHTNTCPAGVATTDLKLQKGLVVEEKKFRVTNYILTMREGLFRIAAAAGLDSPTKFEREHVVYKDERGRVFPVE